MHLIVASVEAESHVPSCGERGGAAYDDIVATLSRIKERTIDATNRVNHGAGGGREG